MSFTQQQHVPVCLSPQFLTCNHKEDRRKIVTFGDLFFFFLLLVTDKKKKVESEQEKPVSAGTT